MVLTRRNRNVVCDVKGCRNSTVGVDLRRPPARSSLARVLPDAAGGAFLL